MRQNREMELKLVGVPLSGGVQAAMDHFLAQRAVSAPRQAL